jgi:hypothetical protein
LGSLDEPLASRVNILGAQSMDELHAYGSDTVKEPKTSLLKDRLVILENIVEKMTYAMYQHGEKVECMETKIGNMRHGFNEAMWEFQETVNMISQAP